MAASKNFRLLFFGCDHFSIRTINPIYEIQRCKIDLVTKPDTALERWAKQRNLKVNYWKNGIKHCTFDEKPNLGLVSSFGSLIDVETIELFQYGLFNIHPSLLPKYRGSSPIQHAILNGDKTTGVTIIQIPPVPKFDVGDIVLQESIEIETREYACHLSSRLADVGSKMFLNFMDNYVHCLEQKVPQSSHEVTFAKKLKPKMGLMNFRIHSSDFLDRKFRAFHTYIDLYFEFRGSKVLLDAMLDPKAIKGEILEKLNLKGNQRSCDSMFAPEGAIQYAPLSQAICIKCSDGKWLPFKKLKMESKAFMSALEFHNGYLSNMKSGECVSDC